MANNLYEFHTVRGYQLLKQDKKLLTAAMEDYLEMIYRNSLVEGYMRINTLSELLNVQASSATKMVQKLAKLGLVNYKRYGIILLTDSGNDIGRFLLGKHTTVETLLKNLGVKNDLLSETELIEHDISTETLLRFEAFNRFIADNPDVAQKLEHYEPYPHIWY